jgi:hypothetical protein
MIRPRMAMPVISGGGSRWTLLARRRNIVGHRSPFFAPIAAVICLGITLGERLHTYGKWRPR